MQCPYLSGLCLPQRPANGRHQPRHQRIAHQKPSLCGRDAGNVREAPGKPVEHFQLLGHQAPKPPIRMPHHVRRARRTSATLPSLVMTVRAGASNRSGNAIVPSLKW